MIRRSDLDHFLLGATGGDAVLGASEDPSFSNQLVGPDDR
jgi:hypothetical protein